MTDISEWDTEKVVEWASKHSTKQIKKLAPIFKVFGVTGGSFLSFDVPLLVREPYNFGMDDAVLVLTERDAFVGAKPKSYISHGDSFENLLDAILDTSAPVQRTMFFKPIHSDAQKTPHNELPTDFGIDFSSLISVDATETVTDEPNTISQPFTPVTNTDENADKFSFDDLEESLLTEEQLKEREKQKEAEKVATPDTYFKSSVPPVRGPEVSPPIKTEEDPQKSINENGLGFSAIYENDESEQTNPVTRQGSATRMNYFLTEEEKLKLAEEETPLALKGLTFPPKQKTNICPEPIEKFFMTIEEGIDVWSDIPPLRNRWNFPLPIPPKEYCLFEVDCLLTSRWTFDWSKDSVLSVIPDHERDVLLEADTDYHLFEKVLAPLSPNLDVLMSPNPIPSFIVCEKKPAGTFGVLSYKRAIFFSKDKFERQLIFPSHTVKLLPLYFERARNLKMKQITNPASIDSITKQLSKIEAMLSIKQYKFGLIFVDKDQDDENLIYSNTKGSAEFDYFCSILGETIALKGYQGFRGGLDVRCDNTGTHSIVTKVKGYQVMFHVCTMLPYQPQDLQKVERKRHIGNDVIVLIFKQRSSISDIFDPKILTSHFNSVFFIVSPHFNQNGIFDGFILNVCSKSGIIPYPPFFTNDIPFFPKENGKDFIDFLLLKMINAERCALHWGEFGASGCNARFVHLQEVVSQFTKK